MIYWELLKYASLKVPPDKVPDVCVCGPRNVSKSDLRQLCLVADLRQVKT